MANFLIAVDPDHERRIGFVHTIQRLVAPFPGLDTSGCTSGSFSALWAARQGTPLSWVAEAEGAAIVWGDAIGESGHIDAAQLRVMWNSGGDRGPEALDGFHAAAVFDCLRCRLTVGTDLLGLFPVFYSEIGSVLLVGSSPELFRHHPLFESVLDPVGLVGVLLTDHAVAGRTPLQGVRRLHAGRLLKYRGGTGVEEVPQFDFPVTARYHDRSFADQVEILHQSFERAVVRHISKGEQLGLLLSGGRDSRMLAGCLAQNGTQATALTFGVPGDHDMECAKPVAQLLHMSHRTADFPAHEYPKYLDLQCKWEHGVNGFGSIFGWGMYPEVEPLGTRIISAYLLDAVLSPTTLRRTSSDPRPYSERILASHVRRGLPVQALRRLLLPEIFGDAISEVSTAIIDTYESYSDSDEERTWRFYLGQRCRFLIGSVLWRMSFGGWPVVPVLDRAFLKTAGGIPIAALEKRRAQDELLRTRFPSLAKLRVAGSERDTTPIQPGLRDRLLQSSRAGTVAEKLLGRFPGLRRTERRYYYRINDFNGPGWRAIRRMAEPYPESVADLFSPAVIREILPSPSSVFKCSNGILDPSGFRVLLGVMHWALIYR